MNTYYQLLGVFTDSTVDEIRAAYYDLARVHHPDMGGDPGFFTDIVHAYAVLSDPKERKRYDGALDLAKARCSRCSGTGRTYSARTGKPSKCTKCQGAGYVSR